MAKYLLVDFGHGGHFDREQIGGWQRFLGWDKTCVMLFGFGKKVTLAAPYGSLAIAVS